MKTGKLLHSPHTAAKNSAAKRFLSALLVLAMLLPLSPVAFAAPSAAKAEGPTDGLALWYKFDETGGDIAKDASGNGYDGTVYGGAQWVTTPAGQGAALRLDNTSADGQYLEIPASVMQRVPDDFTISLWVKVNGTSGVARIFDCGTAASNVMFLTAGKYIFKMDNSAAKRLLPPENLHKKNRDGFAAGYLYPEEYAAPRWEHITLTRRGDLTSLWIDGIRWASGEFQTNVPRTGEDYRFYIGKSNWSADPYASLELKDFRIYNRALSISEILAAMEGGEWSDEVWVRCAADAVDLGDLTGVSENLYLPTSVGGKVRVTWSSDNTSVLQANANIGTLHRPDAGQSPAHANLTATFSRGEYTQNVVYDVTVLPKEADETTYTLSVDAGKVLHAVSPTMYGAFFEDISYAGDGGLYPELLRNTCFHDAADSIPYWHLYTVGGAAGAMSPDKNGNLNEAQFQHLKLEITDLSDGGAVGIRNEGYNGMEFETGKNYVLTFYARTDDFPGSVSAKLYSATGDEISAAATVASLSSEWTKYTLTLAPTEYAAQGELVILCTGGTGTVCFDVVSLCPAEGYGSLGLREDMAQSIEDMHPTFLRFPGGCYIEGANLTQAFRWKETLYSREMRAGHDSIWGYRVTDGLGYFEFLKLCEELGCEPMYVCGVGIAHGEFTDDWNYWIRDVLDAIEFANGAVTTKWGSVRAEMGHPEPFGLKYIEIGNEANLSGHLEVYRERYQDFYDAIKTVYPYMHLIADCQMDDKTIDTVDLHYYDAPQWFIDSAYLFDGYAGSDYTVYVGEYAVAKEQGLQNLHAALGEAAFMVGMERNSDVVTMSSYAPLFTNPHLQRWTSGGSFFDNSRLYATPSYYVQKLFANYIGDDIIAGTLSASDGSYDGAATLAGGVGLATWNTNVTFSDVKVTSNADGSVLFDGNTAGDGEWTRGKGAWTIENGRLTQTQIATDCRVWLDGKDWSDYTYEVTARKNSGSEAFIILVGQKDTDNVYFINFGGWSNTMSAVQRIENGVKTRVSNSVNGVFASDRDYKIKVVVSDDVITVFVDGEKMFEYRKNDIPGCPLYWVAQKDCASGDILIKAVNVSDNDFTANIELAGAADVGGTAEAHILTAENKFAENSFAIPENVIPVTVPVSGAGNRFEYTFMRNAVTVLVIPTGDTAANKTELAKAVAAEKANGLGGRRFTSVSGAAYDTALANAEAVLADDTATQTEVNAALGDLLCKKALLAIKFTLRDVLHTVSCCLDGQSTRASDYNNDGKTSLADALYLLNKIAGES